MTIAIFPDIHSIQASINSGFGGIHGAILTLAAKCLASGRWVDDVRPQSDSELLDASAYAPGELKSLAVSLSYLTYAFRAWL